MYFSKFPMSSRAVRLAKGYSIEQQQRMDKKYAGDLPDFGSPFIQSAAADAEDNKQALVCTNDGRRLRGFTVANNTGNYTYSTAYYDADFKGTSAVYNQPDDLYAMWGYYTVSVYSNVQLSYTVQKTHWSNSEMTNVAHYGTVGTGTIGASNSNPLRVDDVYSYTVNAENLWRQSKWGNVRVGNGPYGLNPQYGAVPTGTDDASYERNYRTLTLKAPTGYEFVEARLGSPSGSVIERKQYTNSHTNISGNISIYLIYKDTRSTVNIYTSVRTAWTPGSKMMYDASGSYTSSVAGPAKGESGDEFKSPFVIRDVQAVDFWPSSTINTHNRSYSEPDKSGFSVNNRLSLPAYHEIESVQYRYGDTGDKTDVTYSTQNKFEYKYKMDGRPFNIYITYKDNTPNDTITWKADGGYLNGDTKVTETSNTAKRGTKVTAPAIARANSTDTRYTNPRRYSAYP